MDSGPHSGHPGWVLPDMFQYLESKEAAAILGDLVETFRADTAARLQIVRTAIADADLSGIRAEIHSIKGSARQMGAEALAAACQEIELKIIELPAAHLAERIDQLEVHLNTACRAMRSYVNQL